MTPKSLRRRRKIVLFQRRAAETLTRLGVGLFVVVTGVLAFPYAQVGPAFEPAARFALLGLFVAAFALYLRFEQPKAYRDTKFLALCSGLAAITFVMAALVTRVAGLTEFAVPVVFGPLILSILFNKRLALVFALLLTVALAATAGFRPEFIPVAVVSSVVAVYAVTGLRARRHVYRAFVYIALSQAAALVAVDLGALVSLGEMGTDILAGGAGSLAACLLMMAILPLIEWLYQVPSDITLLELSDLNRPLLRKLMLAAPGTYHHSLIVGAMAEMAAESIGANALLARVGAYYHDIGKITKPEYFTENETGTRSRHANLAPSMSALVIKSHVVEGIDIARKEKLPRVVRDVIAQHHGTTVAAFFFAKALDLDPATPDDAYRYSGPKPQSREAGVVMLADSVEGASRSLQDPTPARLRGLVTKILNLRLSEGQLDDSGLNLSDVAKIRESFITVLTGRFHTRVPYPELPTIKGGVHESPQAWG
jgi:putative nucleotidyltransferase with HDIG domain